MKYLILPLLVSCMFSNKSLSTKLEECAREIKRYEHFLVFPPSDFFNYKSRCDINPTMEMCSCSDIKELPLNCAEVGIELDRKINSRENAIKEWKDIVKIAKKKRKDDKETLTLLHDIKFQLEIMNIDVIELEKFTTNRFRYRKMCRDAKHSN